MPRKGSIPRRETVPDPRFENVLVSRFVSGLMGRGKRALAEGHFYGAMKILEEKTGQDAMTVLKQAMTNVKPVLGTEVAAHPDWAEMLIARLSKLLAKSIEQHILALEKAKELRHEVERLTAAAAKRADS